MRRAISISYLHYRRVVLESLAYSLGWDIIYHFYYQVGSDVCTTTKFVPFRTFADINSKWYTIQSWRIDVSMFGSRRRQRRHRSLIDFVYNVRIQTNNRIIWTTKVARIVCVWDTASYRINCVTIDTERARDRITVERPGENIPAGFDDGGLPGLERHWIRTNKSPE